MGRPEALGWRVLAAGALGLLVAGADPIPVGEEYAGRIREERARLDERTRAGEVTPFTPVATRMLAPGEWVEVAVCGEEVRFVAEDGCRPAVRLRYTGAAFQQAGADGGASEVGARLELGRFRLALSPQGDSGRVQVHDPGAEAQRAFDGYRWYAPDPAYRFQVEVEPYEEQEPIRMATTTGLAKTFRRYGRVRFHLRGTAHALSVYLPEGGDPRDPSSFFIPFRDATTGQETYGVGRYAHLERDGDGPVVLDFNMAGNPNCAYNAHWNCPIPPSENVLEVPIRAGELPYAGAEHP